MTIGTALLTGLVFVLQATAGHADDNTPRQRFQFEETHMGVPFRISVYASTEAVANKAVAAAYDRIEQLNRIFSDYDPDSEVSRLRSVASGTPVRVSADLAKLLDRSQAISRDTQGAFDVTVGPLVRLWRRARRRRQLPEEDLLQRARTRSGYQLLTVKGDTVTFAVEGMRLDFGAIAKGYACDEALAVLRRFGLPAALVDGGGDIAVGDAPPGRDAWRVLIESEQGGEPPDVLLLKNQAVATSGDRYRYVEVAGVRYSHIVDPRTGVGLTNRIMVTVVAPNATDADAYASAVSVLGRDAGLALARGVPGIEVMIRDESKVPAEIVMTEGFRSLLLTGAAKQSSPPSSAEPVEPAEPAEPVD